MATLHMTEAEVARDLPGVVDKVSRGIEIAIERDHRVVAVIKTPLPPARNISDVIAAMEAGGANSVVDEDFAKDVEAGIALNNEQWHPPSWD